MNNLNASRVWVGRVAVSAWIATGLSLACSNASAALPKDVLFSAIKNGSSSEIITGSLAESWQAKSRSTSPVLMTAKVVKRYKGECARLSVTMRQENVPLKDKGTAPFEFTYELNLCTDGLPPAETVDWSTVPQDAPSTLPSQIR